MLDHITIKNFTIIDELSLDLHNHMTVITGETGSGKSIVIDAVEFALGERTSPHSIYPGANKCDVTLGFSDIADAQTWLEAHDLDADEASCIIRRVLNLDGRSRYTINGTPCTAKLLRELSVLLLSIHGQHAHQSLLKSSEQRDLLDQYAGHTELVEATHANFASWKLTQAELIRLKKSCHDSSNQLAFIQYQLNELDDLNLHENEVDALHAEHKQLHHCGKLANNTDTALQLLSTNDHNTIEENLSHCIQLLTSANAISPQFSAVIELLNSANIQIEEAVAELRHLDFSGDPDRLAEIDARLDLIQKISRKHHVEPENLLQTHEQLKKDLATLENSAELIEQLEHKLIELEKEYALTAAKLTKSRQKSAKKLSGLISDNMQALSMEGGELLITLEKHEEKISAHGNESIHFVVRTNPGQAFHALQKVVSGGELSRISLAIQVITAQKSSIPTLIFDEVDVGIGGKTAEIVGNLLQQLGQRNQLLCITHLPQVAAKGSHHITVTKEKNKTSTEVHIKTLNAAERVKEIARMLGGITISKQTLAHAEELLA